MNFLTAWVTVQYHCRAVKRAQVSLSAHTNLLFPGTSSLQQSSNFITLIPAVGKSWLLYLDCFSALVKDAQTVVCDPDSLDCPFCKWHDCAAVIEFVISASVSVILRGRTGSLFLGNSLVKPLSHHNH